MAREPARIIDGKALSSERRRRIAERVRTVEESGRTVRLDAVLAATDHGARLYAESQAATCARVGIGYQLHELPGDAAEAEVLALLDRLNTDDGVSAVMVHLPLPDGVDQITVQSRIAPEKDVEGVNPTNIGNIIYGRSSLAPCTALAALALIDSTGVALKGKRAVVVGASNHVGKPIAVLLMRSDATTISCNEWTRGLEELTRTADVLVAAVGKPDLITADMVKPGAVVIDVGINRVSDGASGTRTVGDVAFDRVRRVAGHLTPVPGGVGPMTVAMLLENVVRVAEGNVVSHAV
ncbi:MAG: bifunctional 5,10-methylenetetrahydrofolate dehydrogenase/5,10-methenyltetrahydrofolate cyclohydrolase [Planctomycetota bacterium]